MKQIRQRFIKIALLALTLAMLLVAGVINAVHYVNTTSELKETLNYLVESENNNTQKKQGKFDIEKEEALSTDDSAQLYRHKGSDHRMNTKLEESRYFIAIQSADGEAFQLVGIIELQHETVGQLQRIESSFPGSIHQPGDDAEDAQQRVEGAADL